MAALIPVLVALPVLAVVLMARLRFRLVRAHRSPYFCRNCWFTHVDLTTGLRCPKCGTDATGPLPKAGTLITMALPLAIGIGLRFAAAEFSSTLPNPAGDRFVVLLQFGPLIALAATSAILAGLLSTRRFAVLTAAGSIPALGAGFAVLYGSLFPGKSGDLFGGTVIFIWIFLSVAGLVVGALGQAITAGSLLLALRDPHPSGGVSGTPGREPVQVAHEVQHVEDRRDG